MIKAMMIKAIWIIVVLVIGGYFVNSYMEDMAEQAEAKRIEQATELAVAQMVSRSGAIDDWEPLLSKGETFRFEPILTVDLERLWLQNRPILFIGFIKDIATHDQSHYTVSLKRSIFSSKHMFDTELQLYLLSKKERIDSFFKKYPDLFKGYGFNSGVAVVARINAIRTMYVSGGEGGLMEVRIGDGELVDIIYTGNVRF